MKYLGTRTTVEVEEIQEWKKKLNQYASSASERRNGAKDALGRFFGISLFGYDGIKRRTVNGSTPKPFKGAANNVLSWGDTALDTELSIAMETFRLAQRVVEPIAGGSASDERSHKLSILLSWAINHIDNFEEQVKLALKYMLCNCPGAALVQILWNKRAIFGPKRITREEVMQALYNTLPEGARSFSSLVDLMASETPQEKVVETVQALTGVDINLAANILDALLDDKEVEYPGIIGYDEGPSIKALEFGTDFILPDYCTDFDFCELWCRLEWVSEAQLRDLAASNGWNKEFVEETLTHGGEAVSNELDCESGARRHYDYNEFDDLYHLCYIYTAEQNDDGAIARYQTVISAAEGLTACGKELLRGRRGRYPAIFVTRERVNENITRSRGLAEISSPTLDLAKSLADAGSNNAAVGSLPPIVAKGTNSKLTLAPLKVISIRPSAEVKFLPPPAYPAQGTNEYKRLKDEFNERLGIATKESDLNSIAIRRRDRMAEIVKFLKQLLTGLLSVTQAHISNKLIGDILDEQSAADPTLRRDIDGAYQVALKVNVDELDRETMITKLQTLGNILPVLDMRREADTSPILRHTVRVMFPEAADEVLAQVNTGSAAEIRDERNNIVQIRTGLQPEMNAEGGWNYEARLNVWQSLLQNNPNFMADWPQEAQMFAQQWLQSLQHLAQQYGANANVGKTGTSAVQPMI